MKFDLAGKLFIQAVEKLDEFLVAMACVALADDFALRDVPDDWLSEKQHRVKSHTISQTAFIDTAGARAA
jgi:hypothetical protein